MNENTDQEKTTGEIDDQYPQELARRLLVLAAQFAAASLTAYHEAYPEQAAMLAQSGGSGTVKIAEILGFNPRVSLINVVGDREIEVAHVLLHRPAAVDLRMLN